MFTLDVSSSLSEIPTDAFTNSEILERIDALKKEITRVAASYSTAGTSVSKEKLEDIGYLLNAFVRAARRRGILSKINTDATSESTGQRFTIQTFVA